MLNAPARTFLTEGEPPIPCVFRATPEDFEVEELALLEPSGAGEHLWLWIEKRGITTDEALARLARALGLPRSALGAAGRKDRHAIARQWISAEGAGGASARALALQGESLRVLRAERHERKLRTGALRGNRFRLRLRGLAPSDRPRLERVLAELLRRGLPNYYGAQRFGLDGRGAELGRMLLEQRWREYALALATPPNAPDRTESGALRAAIEGGSRSALERCARAARALGPELARLARQLARRPDDWRAALRTQRSLVELHLSALQAAAFNRLLALRVGGAEGLAIDRLAPGDLAFLHERGAVFAVLEPAELEARLATFEISPSGGLPGHRLSLPSGLPLALEERALHEEGIRLEDFRGLGLGPRLRGARRPLRVRLEGLELGYEGSEALLGFALEKGAYASALVDELRKETPAAPLQ